jgi:hypothetical protein
MRASQAVGTGADRIVGCDSVDRNKRARERGGGSGYCVLYMTRGKI